MGTPSNFDFSPKPITAMGLRLIGAGLQLALPKFQRIAALRAYAEYESRHDFMDGFLKAYVVALATRSADDHLMRSIQSRIIEPKFNCAQCWGKTFSTHSIRAAMFPRLGPLRKHANTLIHHLDCPKNLGIDSLNIAGVFDYCHHLFEENAEAVLGDVPHGNFAVKQCDQHVQKRASRSPKNG